jgi:hypothetical protein
MFTFGPGTAARPSRAGTGTDVSGRLRGDVPRNCVRGFRRVGWPRLICGQARSMAAFAQVKVKREDLTRVFPGQRPYSSSGPLHSPVSDLGARWKPILRDGWFDHRPVVLAPL